MKRVKDPEIWQLEICPYSNLPIYSPKEWQNCTFEDSRYRVSFALIGTNFIYSKGFGFADETSIENFLKLNYSIIRQEVPATERYYFLADYSTMKGTSIKGRNKYLNRVKKDTRLAGIINFNVPPFFKLILKTGYRIAKPGYSVHVVNNYNEAIAMALSEQKGKQTRIFNESDTKAIPIVGRDKVDNFIQKKIKELHSKHINDRGTEVYVQELLEFIADMNWESGAKFRNTKNVDDDHPFKPVFDSLKVIKHDFDMNYLKHEKAQQDLKRAYDEMEERVAERTAEVIVTNRQLAEAKNIADTEAKKASEANNAKSTFLANISHEIRTPFNGIMGFAQLIANSNNPKMNREYSIHIIKECKKLLFLVNQLLDLSKIEAGKIELEKITFSIEELFNDLAINFRPPALNKGLYFKTKVHKDVPQFLLGDVMKIRQILFNLLGNSIKFTQKGGIVLSVEMKEDVSEKDKTIVFKVKDTGVGIDKEKQPEIFKSFTQADSSITRKFGGTGLGTTISKEFVELMNGEIGLVSEKASGSTFWFSVELQTGNEEDVERIDINFEEVPLLPLRGIKILAAEDYQVNRDILENFLQTAEAEITLVENGELALEAFNRNHYDCILMDLMMPKMGGLEATEIIRKSPKGKDIPIIGITANAFEKDRQACLEVGMNDFIAKPFDMGPLIYKIGKWVLPEDVFNNSIVINRNIGSEEEDVQASLFPCDVERYIKRMNGDKEIVKIIINGFIDQIEKQIPLMEKAIRENDPETLEREAHSIKGGALNIIADDLMSSAKDLEFASKEKIPAEATQLIENIKDKFAELKSYLNENHKEILS